MKLGKRGLLAWVLALTLLLTCVQAGAANNYGTAPKGTAQIARCELKPLSNAPGIVKSVQGKKIIYQGSKTLSAPGKRLTGGRLTAKTPITSISLSPMDGQMGLNGDWNPYSVDQPLLFTAQPTGEMYQVTVSNIENDEIIVTLPGHGLFDLVSDSKGNVYLEAQKTGKGTVAIQLDSGAKASKGFTIGKKVLFSSMAIGELTGSSPSDFVVNTLKSKALHPGESARLLAIPKPYTATYYDCPIYDYWDYCTSAVNFTSSNPKVATVGAYGRVVALTPGTATLTAAARDGSKKKASIALTVQPYPMASFALTESGPLTLAPGTTHQLSVNIAPSDYYDKGVLWSSSDTSVAKVDANGLVTAVSSKSSKKKGTNTVVITAKSKTGLPNAVGAVSVTVSYDKAASGATYRFYGIGNSDYGDGMNLPACSDDVELMAQAYIDAGLMLNANAFAYHSKTGNEIRGILQGMVDNTAIDDSDVTVFYYSGHGTDGDDLKYRGALCGTDILTASDDSCYVTVDDVQSYLDRVPGTVVVILDSCLSGEFITAKSASAGRKLAAVRAFNSAWVSQLSSSRAANFTAKALTGSAAASKYKILTAFEALEESWGGGANDFGWFTYWAGMGLGRVPNASNGSSTPGALKADANNDRAVTLQELYKYVSANVAKNFDPVAQQHTQVWPANDNFAVLIK